jgi:hypothetical protein
MSLRAFISHASGECALATLLKDHIESDFLGLIDVFASSDGTSIVVGEEWLDKITERLRNDDVYFVLCSQDSLDRPWVNIELGAALTRDKMVFPLCHTDLKANHLERVPWSRYQAVDAADPAGLMQFYGHLARLLGVRVPKIDFVALSKEVHEFECLYAAQKKTIKESAALAPSNPDVTDQIFTHPSVLCVSSAQFRATVREDLQLILAAFPQQAHHVATTTSAELKAVLMTEHFNIIHVASFVCPITGDLVFSEVDPVTKHDLASTHDGISGETFTRLVREAEASLVILANNETLALVTQLLPVTSVVFPFEPVDSKALVEWIKAFYGLMAKGSTLSEACRKSFVLTQIPMMLYPKLEVEAAMYSIGH